MVMSFETIGDQPFTKQEKLNRQLHVVHAKLKTTQELSDIYALFCILSSIDFNIIAGEYTQGWLMSFIVVMSLLIAANVLIKISIMYITPRLETALFMARYDVKEYDLILHDDLIFHMEYIWVAASLVTSLLFGINFICIAWVRYEVHSPTSATSVTAIMTPVLLFYIVFATYSYVSIKRRHKKRLFNEEGITSGSPKVEYSRMKSEIPDYYYYNEESNVGGSRSSRWDLIRAHVYRDTRDKTHNV